MGEAWVCGGSQIAQEASSEKVRSGSVCGAPLTIVTRRTISRDNAGSPLHAPFRPHRCRLARAPQPPPRTPPPRGAASQHRRRCRSACTQGCGAARGGGQGVFSRTAGRRSATCALSGSERAGRRPAAASSAWTRRGWRNCLRIIIAAAQQRAALARAKHGRMRHCAHLVCARAFVSVMCSSSSKRPPPGAPAMPLLLVPPAGSGRWGSWACAVLP